VHGLSRRCHTWLHPPIPLLGGPGVKHFFPSFTWVPDRNLGRVSYMPSLCAAEVVKGVPYTRSPLRCASSRLFRARAMESSRARRAFTGAVPAVAPVFPAFFLISLIGAELCHALGAGRTLLATTNGDPAQKACALVLKSEEKLTTNGRAPGGLAESVVQGRWTYQKTNAGVRKHASLPSGHWAGVYSKPRMSCHCFSPQWNPNLWEVHQPLSSQRNQLHGNSPLACCVLCYCYCRVW